MRGRAARQYLADRGVSPEMAGQFQLGYSPNDWHALEHYLERRGFKARDAAAAGLLSRGEQGKMWDRFRERLIFSHSRGVGKSAGLRRADHGAGGAEISQQFRHPPSTRKAIICTGCTRPGPICRAGAHALLTEGYLDVIALHQHGFPQACGVLGTSLTPAQVKRLSGLCREVVLVFDGDPAGEKAALRSAQMLIAQGMSCRAVLLPQGEDADSLLKSQGAQAFAALLQGAREGLDFCLGILRRTSSSKDVVDWALHFLDELPSAEARAGLLTRLAQGLGLGEHELRALAAGRAGGGKGKTPGAAGANMSALAKKDAEFLEFAIRAPAYIKEMERLGMSANLNTDRAKAFFNVLAAHPGQDVLPYLDERQKSYWGQCASKTPPHRGRGGGLVGRYTPFYRPRKPGRAKAATDPGHAPGA